jgi:hypothetical protein
MFGIKWMRADNNRLVRCVIAQREEILRLRGKIESEKLLRSARSKKGWETRKANA